MRVRRFLVVCVVLASFLVVGGLALAAPPSDPTTLAKGGQLYDKWWTAAGVAAPQGDQPLWSTQTTNTRKGLDTWRCKECHGWDYKGKDGAYSSGSHKTGFAGIVEASKTKPVEQIAAILKGSSNPNHDFTPALDDASINALAAFVKDGVDEDLSQYVDYATKKPKEANVPRGKQMYTDTCAACHGADGKTLNFGSEQEPEWVGTIAVDNPQEFLHKVTFGQPGAPMPAGVQLGWTLGDAADVLAHAQTLQAEPESVAPASEAALPTLQAAAQTPTRLPRTGEPTVLVALVVVIGLVLLASGWITRKLCRDRLKTPLR
ncbi:MAG: c-type cytochrome [Chloroflexi bacterium]|nr:c-type cytochrome [Chloroflexota bacterium]